MERLTTMHGGMMVPRKACMFDRDGGADDCKECAEICEDEGGVCRTCILQECLTRLGAYEDTGLTPEQIRELKERDTAKAPKEVSEEYGYFECPSCGMPIYASDNFESHKFCLNCGQRLEWEE